MIRKVTKQRREEPVLEWPESFYGVRDCQKRKQVLEERIEAGIDVEDNLLRMELWKKRYGTRGRESQQIDYFIRAWMSLKYIYGNRKSFFYRRKMIKEMEQVKYDLCLDWGDEQGSVREQLLYDEMFHLGNSYIELCLEDKSYTSVVFGMGQMKNSSVQNKIGEEIKGMLYELPHMLNMDKDFRVLTQAVSDCFNEKFPDAEIQLNA